MTTRLKVASLVDLVRNEKPGGHIRGWERLAEAAAQEGAPIDLTVFFSGTPKTESLNEHVRFVQLPPVFSTAKLKFMPYVPDHTDLASWHPALAAQLADRDVVHTTDAYFCFTRTAEKLKQQKKIALSHSFHTDAPAYARIFTAKTINGIVGQNVLSHFLNETLKLPEAQEQKMLKRLRHHLSLCDAAFATRPVDLATAKQVCGEKNVSVMRLGVNKARFNPALASRAAVASRWTIPPGRILIMFVGRVDIGKNIYTLVDAVSSLVSAGLPLHLFVAGVGPAQDDVIKRLPGHSTVPGYVSPDDLARLYASADVLAMVSEVEIRSMAMVEALASGLPVLVSEKSGLAQLFASTPAIRVVAGGAGPWAAALQAFATDATVTTAMKSAAQEYGAKQIASWHDVLTQDLLPVWQRIAAARA